MSHTPDRLHAPTLAWMALLALTFTSLALGEWLRGISWLPLLVAGIIWIKGTLVARHFIESDQAHPFIAWVLRVFLGFAALALVLTSWFGDRFARWTTL